MSADAGISCETLDLQTAPDFWAQEKPEHLAVIDVTSRISYREFAVMVNRLASSLVANGLVKGDSIVAMLPNWYEAPVLFFAAAKAGAVLVFCDEVMESEDLIERLERVEPRFVILARADLVDDAQTHAPTAKVVTVRFAHEGCCTFADVLAAGKDTFDAVCIDRYKDTFIIGFTSGSTGQAKGVEITQESSLFSWRGYGRAMQCSSDDVFIVPIPISHLFGVNMGMVLPIMFGASTLLIEKFRAEEMLRMIEVEKVSVIYGVPTVFGRLLLEAKKHPADLSSVRTGLVGSATVSRELVESIRERLHCNVVIGYGSTEAIAVSCTQVDDSLERSTSTVGTLFEGVEARLIDADGNIIEQGEGELIVKSPCMMKRYYRDPEKTAEVLKDGWVHTGDMVSIDDDGYLKILGRIDGMINRGGFKIYASELEHLYSAHPDVLEVCVFPIPHKELGQQTCVVLHVKKGIYLDAYAMREYAVGKVAKFTIPDRIIFYGDLPKLPSGKYDIQSMKSAVVS